MKFEQEGDHWVSTPIFVGSAAAVEQMVSCYHDWKDGKRAEIMMGSHPLLIQNCTLCKATRLRTIKLLPNIPIP